jgi:hypothetical protein
MPTSPPTTTWQATVGQLCEALQEGMPDTSNPGSLQLQSDTQSPLAATLGPVLGSLEPTAVGRDPPADQNTVSVEQVCSHLTYIP